MSKDQTVLFHSTIFGPIHSRRLGVSLGVNLMPNDGKICSFDCIYCEAGFNAQGAGSTGLPSREQVRADLDAKLSAMHAAGDPLDVITFSGNGEPTLHPEFAGIAADVMQLRDKYYPDAKVSVLTNSTRLADPAVCEALRRVDNNILKLDSALDPSIRAIDRPQSPAFSAESVISQLEQFAGQGIIQTMMLRGTHDGHTIDNTTPREIEALAAAYRRIRPREVMLYSIDRSTPAEHLQKVERPELEEIGRRLEQLSGVKVQVN